MNGLVVTQKKKGTFKAIITRITSVSIGRNNKKRGFTLTPGVKTNWRRTVVNGGTIGDAPTKYTIKGLKPYELPVIGKTNRFFFNTINFSYQFASKKNK